MWRDLDSASALLDSARPAYAIQKLPITNTRLVWLHIQQQQQQQQQEQLTLQLPQRRHLGYMGFQLLMHLHYSHAGCSTCFHNSKQLLMVTLRLVMGWSWPQSYPCSAEEHMASSVSRNHASCKVRYSLMISVAMIYVTVMLSCMFCDFLHETAQLWCKLEKSAASCREPCAVNPVCLHRTKLRLDVCLCKQKTHSQAACS